MELQNYAIIDQIEPYFSQPFMSTSNQKFIEIQFHVHKSTSKKVKDLVEASLLSLCDVQNRFHKQNMHILFTDLNFNLSNQIDQYL